MTQHKIAVACRIGWCRQPLGTATYSFGDGLGNVYRKCGGGHWTPEPPPPDLAAIDDADAYDGEGLGVVTEQTAATAGCLFSGIGGLDLGLERAGWRIAWQSEFKPAATQVLARHWPTVPNLGDITTIQWSTVERTTLIAGGFPCQDLSHAHTAGARAGLAGAESGLWTHFVRAVEHLEPEWVLVENVDTWRSWVPTVRADLSGHGYASVHVELSAGSFGAPHRRPRHFVVAHAHGDSEPLLAIHAEVEKLCPVSGRDRGNWWHTRPRTVRVDDGISGWMGQNDLYGNAVVPQVAEYVGRLICDAAQRTAHNEAPA